MIASVGSWLIGLGGATVLLFWVLASLVWARRSRPAAVQRSGRVTLILPLAGHPPGLPVLLEALAAQTLRPARLILAVERGDSVAAAAVAGAALPFPVEVVTAPPAIHCSQKCANLVAGLAHLVPEDEAAVLLDADILPQPWWLSTLATPVLDGTADMVTGYRWLRPSGSLAAHLVAWTDRSYAALPRSDRMPIAWGGSLALGPRALAGGEVERTLHRTLSDDLSLAEMAAKRKLRLLTRRILLLPTVADGSPLALLRFLARQYRIVHLYRPALWWAATLSSHAVLLFWGWLLLRHPAWLLVPAAAGAVRWAVNDAAGRRVGAPDAPATRAAQLLLGVTPLPELLNACICWASAWPRRVVWRHVTYHVAGPLEVRVLSRATLR
ncbi:glycosyltransferase [Roseomonas sp. BN140053]|uniref:glycosyltransferase n=1 Tax=Roseomonas sp. BN140053 TaxID=3391898 RepID=UPI0039E8F68E